MKTSAYGLIPPIRHSSISIRVTSLSIQCVPGKDNPGCSADGRCPTSTPVTDPTKLHGFWLVRPDGSHSQPYDYLAGKIAEAAV